MNNLKRKGFTLIELLAVIVILAIIALIAVPAVMNIIDKANMSAFKDSAYGIIKAGDLYYAKKEMLDEELLEETFEFPNGADKLKIKGQLPKDGNMIIDEDGNIAMAITNGKYCITKNFDDKDIKLLENTSRCAIPYTLAAVVTTSEKLSITKVDECIKRGTLCDFGADVEEPTSFAIEVNDTDIYKFYVIDDDGKEVTMIMDRNLGESIAWISENDYNEENNKDDNPETCNYGSCTDEGPITAFNTLIERTDTEWSNIPNRTYTIVDDKPDSDGTRVRYEPLTITSKARLLTYTEATTLLDCKSWEDNSCKQFLFLHGGDGFWLSTAESYYDRYAWIVSKKLSLTYVYPKSLQSIRPVITLSK